MGMLPFRLIVRHECHGGSLLKMRQDAIDAVGIGSAVIATNAHVVDHEQVTLVPEQVRESDFAAGRLKAVIAHRTIGIVATYLRQLRSKRVDLFDNFSFGLGVHIRRWHPLLSLAYVRGNSRQCRQMVF